MGCCEVGFCLSEGGSSSVSFRFLSFRDPSWFLASFVDSTGPFCEVGDEASRGDSAPRASGRSLASSDAGTSRSSAGLDDVGICIIGCSARAEWGFVSEGSTADCAAVEGEEERGWWWLFWSGDTSSAGDATGAGRWIELSSGLVPPLTGS